MQVEVFGLDSYPKFHSISDNNHGNKTKGGKPKAQAQEYYDFTYFINLQISNALGPESAPQTLHQSPCWLQGLDHVFFPICMEFGVNKVSFTSFYFYKHRFSSCGNCYTVKALSLASAPKSSSLNLTILNNGFDRLGTYLQ